MSNLKRFGAIPNTNIAASPTAIMQYQDERAKEMEQTTIVDEKKPFNWLFVSFFGAGILLLILFTSKK